MRVSNFLLWQIAYAEIFVTETLWPDFNRARLLEALVEFQKRERRYGGSAKANHPTRNLCARRVIDPFLYKVGRHPTSSRGNMSGGPIGQAMR